MSPNCRDPDWAVSVARDHLNFEATCARLADFYDEADRATTKLGRRGRYVEHERNVLCLFRDKVRWIRNWYLARTRSSAAEAFPSTYPPEPRGRGSGNGDMSAASKDGAGEAYGSNAPGGGHTGSGNIPTAHGGHAMDLDYGGLNGQLTMPGELDDSFWQAMFDMNGGMAWMNVQA